ncbi:MAG TPA: NAD(P)H-hydrate dehydratase [Jatrophihabitantaceae bacterium]|nr:NAD(P)H-hydrate dehydratase [Jatrophihabitantaceae bacterium]
MHGAYTVDQVRAAENAAMAQLPAGALMQRAAHALSVHCADLLDRVYGARVAVLVGRGNNGGDALFAGARLAARGARVTALLLDPERAHGDGLLAFDRAGGRSVGADPAALHGADLVLDGMLGIGGRGGLRGRAVDLAEAAADLFTVAVDVPSGVDSDTGSAEDTAVRADVTVSFGALKIGTVVGRGAQLCGELRLVDIGLALPSPAARVLEAPDVRAVLPQPDATDDKYTRGVVGVVAGSPQYSGAGVLSTGSALLGGAGMVRYLGLAPDAVRARYPEVVVHDDARPHEVRVQAWVVGPGMGTDDAAMALLADVLRTDVPVIVDADAITLVARAPGLVRGRTAPTVLTPHDREFARLAGQPGADRLGACRRAAADLGATVLLKGNATIIAAADGTAYVNPTGTPWLGTAGSGDVLSGLVGSLLASGLPAPLAAAAAAYLHGVAGQRAAADGPPTAVDVLNSLRGSLRELAALSRGNSPLRPA